jgi:hypothetical protein
VHVPVAPKADKEAGIALSPLCAIRGLAHRSKTALSFDHLVGADHQQQRHVDAEAEARKLATYFLKQTDRSQQSDGRFRSPRCPGM